MANFFYNEAKRAMAEGEIDFVNDDIRVALLMTNTTADIEDDKNFISEFTTLDEYDGAAYVRKALASQVVNEDAPNDRAEFDATDAVWTALGIGTRQCQAALVYKHVTSDADSVPLAFIDSGGFPFDGNGGDITMQWNAEGIVQVG